MLESDFSAFESCFRQLSGALQRKWKAGEFQYISRVYFETLLHADLGEVLAAVPTLRARKRWPKAGDWLAALPAHPTVNTAGARVMGTAEVDEYMDALRRHYHGDPCSCLLCQEAGVTDRPLRFVPDFSPDDVEERAFCRVLNRLVVTGHWAHGHELQRWYCAKAAFAAAVPQGFRRVLELVTREPGEDG